MLSFLRKLADVIVIILAANVFILVLNDEYIFTTSHAVMATIALIIYAWEHLWS